MSEQISLWQRKYCHYNGNEHRDIQDKHSRKWKLAPGDYYVWYLFNGHFRAGVCHFSGFCVNMKSLICRDNHWFPWNLWTVILWQYQNIALFVQASRVYGNALFESTKNVILEEDYVFDQPKPVRKQLLFFTVLLQLICPQTQYEQQ